MSEVHRRVALVKNIFKYKKNLLINCIFEVRMPLKKFSLGVPCSIKVIVGLYGEKKSTQQKYDYGKG